MDESKIRLSEQYAHQHPVVDAQTNAHGGGSGGSERWNAALSNIAEIQGGIDTLQRLLLKQTVYKDEEAFSQVASHANQARHIMAQERRIRALEKELDAAVASAGLARADKRLAEVAQRSAEARTQEVLQELENTTQVFKLHMEELRVKQEELSKKEADIKALHTIIDQMGGTKFEHVETLDTPTLYN